MKALMFPVLCAIGLALAVPVHAAELKVGDPAPDFSLAGTDGKTQALRFQRQANRHHHGSQRSPGCTIECKSSG